MVSLVDIVPQTRKVMLSVGELELRGLGLRQIADLFVCCPMLRNVFVTGAPDVTLADVVIQAPEGIGMVIAYAAGQPDAAGAIANGALSQDEMIECLRVIGELTFPRGPSPLLQWVTVLLNSSSVLDPSGRDPDTNTPLRPNGSLAQDTLSPT